MTLQYAREGCVAVRALHVAVRESVRREHLARHWLRLGELAVMLHEPQPIAAQVGEVLGHRLLFGLHPCDRFGVLDGYRQPLNIRLCPDQVGFGLFDLRLE